MLTDDELRYFAEQRNLLETSYLAGSNPREQSGFSRSAADWEWVRRPVARAIDADGSFLDIGCANGLLMESVVAWAREDGHAVEPYGLDISARLAALARSRLPQWADRIFVGNALVWEPPRRFDFVRTELMYVPVARRRDYVERLLDTVVSENGRLLICAYGSSRPEGTRAEAVLDELAAWNVCVDRVLDVISPEHGFVVTRVVCARPRFAGR